MASGTAMDALKHSHARATQILRPAGLTQQQQAAGDEANNVVPMNVQQAFAAQAQAARDLVMAKREVLKLTE